MPSAPPTPGLWAGVHLGKKLHTHVGEGPRAGQVWKKKPDNWPEVNKDLEELPYINDLTDSLLCSSSLGGDAHILSSPGVYFCLASALKRQTVSLCALPLVLCLLC